MNKTKNKKKEQIKNDEKKTEQFKRTRKVEIIRIDVFILHPPLLC